MVTQLHSPVRTRPLPRGASLAAARVLAGAFLDDPVWQATGPRRPGHRRLVLTALYLAEVLIARLRRAILLGAYQGDELTGVIIVFPDGERLMPWWAWVPRSMACLLAGPVPVARSLAVVSGLDKLHPKQPHAHFWLLGSRPGALGVGYALMRAATDQTDRLGRPGYLEATSPEMAEIKQLLGWTVRQRYPLRTGSVVTTMWRDCPAPS